MLTERVDRVCLPIAVMVVLGASTTAATACSAPAVLPTLEQAEQAEKQGHHEVALAAYERAIVDCRSISNPRLRVRDCAAAHLHHAELLVTIEKKREAISAYEAIESALPDSPTTIAESLYRAGSLRLQLGDDEGGYRQLWRTVTDFPNEQFAGDALRTVVHDGRGRNPRQLYAVLANLVEPLAETRIVDNLLFFLAELAEQEFNQPKLALRHYDAIGALPQKSGLFDDSLWRGADIALRTHDPRGAVARLHTLLATREVAFGAGSYFSVWLDNAQLKVGVILRDQLGDLDAAAAAFTQLPRDYPASILRDDALYHLAITRARQQKVTASCHHLSTLATDFPDSKYRLEKAPQLAARLGCKLQ